MKTQYITLKFKKDGNQTKEKETNIGARPRRVTAQHKRDAPAPILTNGGVRRTFENSGAIIMTSDKELKRQ